MYLSSPSRNDDVGVARIVDATAGDSLVCCLSLSDFSSSLLVERVEPPSSFFSVLFSVLCDPPELFLLVSFLYELLLLLLLDLI